MSAGGIEWPAGAEYRLFARLRELEELAKPVESDTKTLRRMRKTLRAKLFNLSFELGRDRPNLGVSAVLLVELTGLNDRISETQRAIEEGRAA